MHTHTLTNAQVPLLFTIARKRKISSKPTDKRKLVLGGDAFVADVFKRIHRHAE